MKAAFCNLLFLLLISFSSVMFAQTPYGTRDRSSFNDDWLFYKGDAAGATEKLDYTQVKNWLLPSGKRFAINGDQSKLQMPAGNLGEDVLFTHADFDDTSWRRLDLPHDWAIEGDFQQALPGDTGKRPFAGVGWYRKHFNVSAADKGKEFYIDFDGAMAYPEVWFNGHFVGGWAYGYASFRLDLTPYVKLGGDNVIAVRLDNPPDSSRWYPGSGIYRNVWLVKTEPVHVAHWGTYVTTTEVSTQFAMVNVGVTVQNDSATAATVAFIT